MEDLVNEHKILRLTRRGNEHSSSIRSLVRVVPKTFPDPFTCSDVGARLKTVGDTDAIYYLTAFAREHTLAIVIGGIALVYLLLRVTQQR
jgi:hypothetical protein